MILESFFDKLFSRAFKKLLAELSLKESFDVKAFIYVIPADVAFTLFT